MLPAHCCLHARGDGRLVRARRGAWCSRQALASGRRSSSSSSSWHGVTVLDTDGSVVFRACRVRDGARSSTQVASNW